MKKLLPAYRLHPFLDKDGLLQVGGRIGEADVSDSIKYPVILPRKSNTTTLLIRHYRENCNHGEREMTLNHFRQHGYWIIGGSAADLPQDCSSEAPPFTYRGVDVFGSFLITDTRSFLK